MSRDDFSESLSCSNPSNAVSTRMPAASERHRRILQTLNITTFSQHFLRPHSPRKRYLTIVLVLHTTYRTNGIHFATQDADQQDGCLGLWTVRYLQEASGYPRAVLTSLRFQSDHDLDIICDLDGDLGLHKLQEDAAEKHKKDVKDNASSKEHDEGLEVMYSIFAGHCDDIELVRKHLDSGVLSDMLAKKEVDMLAVGPKDHPYPDPGYIFVLLGACAMTTGCVIPEQYKASMRKVFKCTFSRSPI